MAGICRKLLTGSFALLLSAYALGQGQIQAVAQTTVVSESSSSSSTSTSGDEVIKGYAFKYKERFRNYAEQIDNGQAKGWLSAQKAGEFKDRLEQLKTQDCLLYTSPSPRDGLLSRMPSSA